MKKMILMLMLIVFQQGFTCDGCGCDESTYLQQFQNDEAIACFVESPEAFARISEGYSALRNVIYEMNKDVKGIALKFPKEEWVQGIALFFNGWVTEIKEWSDCDDQVFPFLVLGVKETKQFSDPNFVQEMKSLQVRIFKNFLTRFNISDADAAVLDDLDKFCAYHSTSEAFCRLASERIGHFKKLGVDSMSELVDAYLGPEGDDDEDEEDEEEWNPVTPAEIAWKNFCDKWASNKELYDGYFSKEAIGKLFLEVTAKTLPAAEE